MTEEEVIEMLNQSIEDVCGHFVTFAMDHKIINVLIAPNYELHLTAADAPRLLTMLNLPKEDRIIKISESFMFRKPSKTNKDNVMKIIARNLKRYFIIRVTRFNHKYTDMDNMHHELFQHINFNLRHTGIGGAADFIFDFKENKVEITVQKNVELEFRLLHAPIFMRMLSMTKDVVLTGKTLHVLQKIDRPPLNEFFRLSITDKPTIPVKVKKTEHLELEVGFYKNAEQLKAGKYLGKHLLNTGSKVMSDVATERFGYKKKEILQEKSFSTYQAKPKEIERNRYFLIMDSRACACVKSELDLFSVSPVQLAIDESSFAEIHPVATLSDRTPIEFYVSSQANYAYRSIFDALLSPKAVQESILTADLFYKDTASKHDSIDPTLVGDNANEDLKIRYGICKDSKLIDMMGPLHFDLGNQSKCLINSVNLRIKLERSKDSFALMSASQEFKLIIQHASLFVRKVKVAPTIAIAHEVALSKGVIKMPIRRTEVKSFALSSGIQSITISNAFIGQLPTRLIMGLVSNTEINGDF
ncbi:uncharacterized protein F54H12.2 [Nephila pilipes]|uniref:Uncharacterized protein F54H12.2 n=1 Tax=Nephila pilipes TaxID=299642 RepID=A0A8X6QXQ9_NEPPI|nr:uncharacterized protein F54H12.2 [Nephila pilipes]